MSERSVLVTEHTPRLDSGHGLRRYAIARALASERPLDIVYTVFGAAEPAPEFSGDERFRLHPVQAGRGARRLATYLRALAGGIPRGFARGVSPELIDGVRSLASDAYVVADGPVPGASSRHWSFREKSPYLRCGNHSMPMPSTVVLDVIEPSAFRPNLPPPTENRSETGRASRVSCPAPSSRTTNRLPTCCDHAAEPLSL